MHYLALLFGSETIEPGTPEFFAEMAAYEAFDRATGSAIVAGEALHASDTAVTIRPGGGEPLVTTGPYAEVAEVVGGFFVLDAATLDDAIELARLIPAASTGVVELWPVVGSWMGPLGPGQGSDRYMVLIVAGADEAVAPGTPDWEVGMAEHGAFGAAAGDAIIGGAAVHPPSTATSVRVRGDEVLVTDGPFAETAEVANGLYLLRAPSPEAAAALAARIPVTPKGAVELRPIVDFAALMA